VVWDEPTQTCTAEAWVEQPAGVLPPLTVEDAEVLGAAILSVWAVGFVARACIRALRET
jgi:hypothetical protein